MVVDAHVILLPLSADFSSLLWLPPAIDSLLFGLYPCSPVGWFSLHTQQILLLGQFLPQRSLLIGSWQPKQSSCFIRNFLLSPTSIFLQLQQVSRSWTYLHIGHLDCSCFRLSFFLVNVIKYFVLLLFEYSSVRSKYCSTILLQNKGGTSTTRVSSSRNPIKSTKLDSLLLRFVIANICRFHLSLVCCGNFAIIKHSVSGESRPFQVWLDVTLTFQQKVMK